MTRTSLALGIRFSPTDVELLMYYLKRKVTGKKIPSEVISELNIYKYSPWDLPGESCLRSRDLEWYFFCPKEIKYANGARMNRATESGYWKSTGKDRHVSYSDRTVGMVKTLVFHKGRPPKGDRTNWVMHEYRMLDKELADGGVVQDAYVLCKLFQKSDSGPQNGAQYGAPFKEDDYDDDGEFCAVSFLPVALPSPELPSNNSVFLPGSTSSGPLCGSVILPGSTSSGPLSGSAFVPGSSCILSDSVFIPGSKSSGPLPDPGLSKAMFCADQVLPPKPDNSENIISMLDKFIPDWPPCENGNNEVENFGHVNQNAGLASLDEDDFFSGLDLDNIWSCGGGCTTGLGLAGNDLEYLEMDDLNGSLHGPADDMGYQHYLTDTTSRVENFGHVNQNLASLEVNNMLQDLDNSLECGGGWTNGLGLAGNDSAYFVPNDFNGPLYLPADMGSQHSLTDTSMGTLR